MRYVKVDWEDSSQPVPDWRFVEDIASPEPIRCSSVGFELTNNAKVIQLAQSIGRNAEGEVQQAAGVMTIPANAVIKVEELGNVDD